MARPSVSSPIGSAVSAQTQAGPDRTDRTRASASDRGPQARDAGGDDRVDARRLLRPGAACRERAGSSFACSAESGADAYREGQERERREGCRQRAAGRIHRARQEIDSGAERHRPRPDGHERGLRRGGRLEARRDREGPGGQLASLRSATTRSISPRPSPTSVRRPCRTPASQGKGIKVAVLDSGIDYTHEAFGGIRQPADYAANNPDDHRARDVPDARSSAATTSSAALDRRGWSPAGGPDRIRSMPARGRPRHARRAHHRRRRWRRPGVDLYAVKVCSSVSTSCSGVALIQGMEFAVDPNGDGEIKDRVDLINMSLGSAYGPAVRRRSSPPSRTRPKLGVLDGRVGRQQRATSRTSTGTPAPRRPRCRSRRRPCRARSCRSCEITAPAGIAGNVPAVFQPWSAPLAAPDSRPPRAVRRRRRRQPERLRGVPGRLTRRARSCSSIAAPARSAIKITNIARRRRPDRHHRSRRSGRPVRGRASAAARRHDPRLHDQPGELEQAEEPGFRTRSSASTRASAVPLVGHDGRLVLARPAARRHNADQARDRRPRRFGVGDRGLRHRRRAVRRHLRRRADGDGLGGALLEGFGGVKTTAGPPGQASASAWPVEVKALLMNNAETNIINEPAHGRARRDHADRRRRGPGRTGPRRSGRGLGRRRSDRRARLRLRRRHGHA